MTNEVQTATINNINTSKQQQQQQLYQKRSPFQSSFQSQMMRSNKRTSGNFSPMSAPITTTTTTTNTNANATATSLTDNRLTGQLQQAQSTQLKPSKRDLIKLDKNSQEDTLQTANTKQESDDNGAHFNKDASDGGGCNSAADDDVDKQHHVGPVMGIFFKVWSLVKVTKVRNQHKIRRQNSEDTAQFQYIPGSQLAGGSQQQRHSAGGLLEDRHFRRAGSQPAPSSSRSSDQFAISGKHQHTINLATGTSSTSSGVSSATSSYLATSDSNSAARHHLSANSLRRSTGTTNAVDKLRPASQQQVGLNPSSTKSSFSAKTTGGWAAKIKRSATTVNQADVSSYASRYRFRRANQSSKLGAAIGGRLVVGSKSEERTTSEEESRRDGTNTEQGNLLIRKAAEREADEEAEEEEEEEGEEEDEEDSNDIYSTPNDSIQSVPITGNEPMLPHQAISVHQVASKAYPIIKSFSTSNFNQLLKQQNNGSTSFDNNQYQPQQQLLQHSKFKPIDELQSAKNSTTQLNQTDLELFQRQDSSQSGSMSRRLNGSRIFISSSSSEDSNHSPANLQQQQQHQQHQHQHQHHQHQHLQHIQDQPQTMLMRQPERQQSSAHLLDQERSQVPLQLGVHYHAPAFRPNSLLFGSAGVDGQLNLVMPISLFTPMSNQAPGTTHLYQQSAVSPSYQPPNYINSIGAYKKSPSMMEIVSGPRISSSNSTQNFNAKFQPTKPFNISSFKPREAVNHCGKIQQTSLNSAIPNSISLHDCKLSSHKQQQQQQQQQTTDLPMQVLPSAREPLKKELVELEEDEVDSEYKLAKMLLEFGSNPKIKDQHGCTALMHAVISDNLPVLKCLIENGADLNEINSAGFTALDLVCIKAPTPVRLEILKFLIDKRANMDQSSERDGTRLLDRLIARHQQNDDKLPFIDCLLQNGAKLGSSTWNAADGKFEIQLRLLEKLCQDGYFLYKQSSIAAAIYRFEYALKRIDELEQQLSVDKCRHAANILLAVSRQSVSMSARQIKYQTYLGLSRCERKRKFYKRAMEFAHMAILVDSTSYEGYYSKAQILKDLGELDDSLKAIDQTSRLVEKSIENLNKELETLHQQEEAMIFDGCFDLLDKCKPSWFGKTRLELNSNLDYLEEAKKFIARLKAEIMNDKLRVQSNDNLDGRDATIFPNSTPIAT